MSKPFDPATLPDDLAQRVSAQLAPGGAYTSAEDLIRDGVALVEKRQRRLAALRAAIAQGANRPESTDIDGAEAFRAIRARFNLPSPRG